VKSAQGIAESNRCSIAVTLDSLEQSLPREVSQNCLRDFIFHYNNFASGCCRYTRLFRVFFHLFIARNRIKCALCVISLVASRECRANNCASIVWWTVYICAIILNLFANAVHIVCGTYCAIYYESWRNNNEVREKERGEASLEVLGDNEVTLLLIHYS